MASELNLFSFPDVVEAICAKMIRRHPHVFGPKKDLSPEAVKRVWAQIKDEEKRQRREERQAAGLAVDDQTSVLDGVPTALPGLTRAVKLQDKASKVGFDWNNPHDVLKKSAKSWMKLRMSCTAMRKPNLPEKLAMCFLLWPISRGT